VPATAICSDVIEILSPTVAGIARARTLLLAGELVAFGTETVYGLGADATHAEAVGRVFAAKDRPRFNPLICHYPDAEAAFAHVAPNLMARSLASLWPGPLSMVLSRRADCPVALLTGAGLDTLAVRVPAHETTLALLRATGRPIAAPSANRSGRVSPTTAAHVVEDLQDRIAAVIDSGPCPVGVESTVLDLTGPQPVLLRPGGITLEAIEAVIGAVAHESPETSGPRSPGRLASHYAPRMPLRLNATDVADTEALLAFGAEVPEARLTVNLSERGDLLEAAARLFQELRWLDAEAPRHGMVRIAVMPIPRTELGLAINDRLQRAAAPRPRS